MNKAFAFNRDAAYKAGAFYSPGTTEKLAIAGPLNIVVSDELFLGLKESSSTSVIPVFTARVPDIFSQYKLPNINSNHVVDLWGSQPMGFWQNQLNFAIWCATTGCGVSAKQHLGHSEAMIRALYIFHTYYQVRRILSEIKASLPGDESFNVYENSYDNRAYQRICSEFGVPPNTDWKRKGLPNYGLGKVYTAGHPIGDGWFFPNPTFGWRGTGGTNIWHDYSAPSGYYKESFTKQWGETEDRADIIHADYIIQDDAQANTAWSTFIVDESQGFTQAGVVRLNESVMTYVWAILGAQAQTRTGIIGTGQAFEAQKQFLVLVEDAITHEIDLPQKIKRYQDVLQYARSKVDYVYGIGLYMAPSDMLLRVGNIQGYNNMIVTATADMVLGSNAHINDSAVPPPPPAIREPIPAHHEGSIPSTLVNTSTTSLPGNIPSALVNTSTSAANAAASRDHQNEKTALVVTLVTLGLAFLWFRGR